MGRFRLEDSLGVRKGEGWFLVSCSNGCRFSSHSGATGFELIRYGPCRATQTCSFQIHSKCFGSSWSRISSKKASGETPCCAKQSSSRRTEPSGIITSPRTIYWRPQRSGGSRFSGCWARSISNSRSALVDRRASCRSRGSHMGSPIWQLNQALRPVRIGPHRQPSSAGNRPALANAQRGMCWARRLLIELWSSGFQFRHCAIRLLKSFCAY